MQSYAHFPKTARLAVMGLRAQGLYYVATGLWPLLHLGSFESVTGPKVDDWLVRMVGLLVLVIGGTLILGTRGPGPVLEVVALAAGSAAAFAAIDLWYGLSGRIAPVYLADAAVQLGFVGLLTLVCARGARARGAVPRDAGRHP